MRKLLFLFAAILTFSQASATHERAGEITFKHLFGLTYEVTILTYTFAPSPADRPELLILWGDGSGNVLPRVEKIDLLNDLRRNKYVGQHTYSGPDSYIISVEDPNRNYGIINIPGSVNVPFYVQTELIINPFLGPNNSPQLLLPPIDNGCVNIPFLHNPGAYDVDGDSLSYRLIDCKGAGGLPILGYSMPAASNVFYLNPVTGDLLWDSPVLQGEYNIAILIEEWRNGIRIGSVTRDMQINIVACNQEPPVIDPLNDTCVLAGTILQFDVTASDPDNNYVTLIGTGGPMVTPISPATFPVKASLGTVTSTFTWQTVCEHVRKSPYTAYFKATDNGQPVNLVDIESMNITVVGPAPENLAASPKGNNIVVTWDSSVCDNVTGYSLYRRVGYYGFVPDHCETGVPAYTGYIKIADISGLGNTTYTDDDGGKGLVHGLEYCYIAVATFPDGALSYASLETCASLKRDVPIITNVSINHTSATDGSVYVAWARPTELDPVQTPGPFVYHIYRSEGSSGQVPVLIDSTIGINDTIFTDTLINTADKSWSYRIDLINNTPGDRFFVGSSQWASSVFLTIQPTDASLKLNWTMQVPWVNDSFVVFRENDISGIFDSIAIVSIPSYTDTGLMNGEEYCYYVKSVGRYFLQGLVNPIINLSERSCAIPLDNLAPCAPVLAVATNCDLMENLLTWVNPAGQCAADVAGYSIYYRPYSTGDFQLIATISVPDVLQYLHKDIPSIAGCYAVSSVDSTGNISDFSNIVCIDIDLCPRYRLPNVFTPNSDGSNDLYGPFPYTSVESVDITIFNRWGGIVYQTTNPDIIWDGTNKASGQLCSDGVYYYVCDVFEVGLEGRVKRTLQGAIHLIR